MLFSKQYFFYELKEFIFTLDEISLSVLVITVIVVWTDKIQGVISLPLIVINTGYLISTHRV